MYSRVFEDKIAQDSKNQYNGSADTGPSWRIFTRNYLMGAMPEVKLLFQWAEDMQYQEITLEATKTLHEKFMLENDPVTMSHHLWRFLNLNLTGDAKLMHQNTELSNGLEVWRKLTLEIVSRSAARRKILRERVWNPRTISSLAAVKISIEQWEGQIKEFVEAGGDAPQDDMRQELLIGILPEGLQEHILWRESDFASYHQLREFIHRKVEHLLRLKSRGRPISLAELGEQATMEEVLKVLPDGATDDAILSAVKGRQWGPRPGGGRPRNPTQNPPPRDRRDISCVNCGGSGHMAAECTAEKLPKHKRPCFICRRPGHLARDCAEKQAQHIDHEDEAQSYNLCMLCEEDPHDGWSKPSKRHTMKPQRVPVTLTDYLSPTFYSKLKEKEEEEDDDKSIWEKLTDQELKDPREYEFGKIEYIDEDGNLGMLEVVWPEDVGSSELNAADAEEPEFIEIELTWDTGAGDSVVDAVDAPGHEVRESRGSRAGACFVGAGGDRMKNQGQVILQMKPEESNADINVPFQVANVTRPLWAMCQVCDGDLEVLFTKTHGEIRDPRRGGKVLARSERKGGLYKSKMRVRNPKYRGPKTPLRPSQPKGFGRQGTRR